MPEIDCLKDNEVPEIDCPKDHEVQTYSEKGKLCVLERTWKTKCFCLLTYRVVMIEEIMPLICRESG